MAQSMRRLVLAAVLAVVVLLFTVPVQHALAALTPTQTAATLAFLQRFPVALPSLSWTGTDYCSWAGVTCDATTGYVSVDLSSQSLAGAMPSFPENVAGALVMVTAVSLANNANIAGTFSENWAALTNLRSLDLSNTALGGVIPDAWNGMTALQTVKVSGTNACRGLPNWNIASLTSADLSNNKMGGALASSWAGMTLLTSVTLTGNSFCGCIPSEWTSALLVNAATAANSALASPTCGVTNLCTTASFVCTIVDVPVTPTTEAPTTAPPAPEASSSSSSSSAPVVTTPTTAAPTTEAPSMCFVANCATCQAGFTNRCAVCNTGYNVRNDGNCMVTGRCDVSNCLQCSAVDNTVCSVCNTGYSLTARLLCRRNAAAAPASMLVTAVALLAAVVVAVM